MSNVFVPRAVDTHTLTVQTIKGKEKQASTTVAKTSCAAD